MFAIGVFILIFLDKIKTNMKEDLINYIKNILKTYGCFNLGELDVNNDGVFVNEMGSLIALAEYFTEDYVEVNVYKPSSISSDALETYETDYEDLSVDILQEILDKCQTWEAQSLQTEKRISNE